MSKAGPVHGTPIHGIGDIAGMAQRADAAAGAALSPDLGGGMSGRTGSGNPTMDLPFLHNRQTFKICSCWKREESNVYGGKMLGCYWVCEAIPVGHWRDWHGAENPPDTFWEADVLEHGDLKTRIWWVVKDPPCCNDNSSSDPNVSTSAFDGQQDSSCGCNDTHEWEAASYPKFGQGQWVECFYDYDAGEWRVIDAFDGTIRFQLEEELVGCSYAYAKVIGFKCETCESSISSNGSSRSIPSISISSCCNPPCLADPLVPQPDIHACPGDVVRQYLIFEDPDNRCAPIEWRSLEHPKGSHIVPNGPKDAVWIWHVPKNELENIDFTIRIEARDKCGCISKLTFNLHIDGCDSNSQPEHTTCRLMKDAKWDPVTCTMKIEYCTLYLMGGSYCTCGDESSSSTSSEPSHATSTGGSSFSSLSNSSSSNPSSSSSQTSACDDCLCESVVRCRVRIYDPMGISNTQFHNWVVPPKFTGYAHWFADKRRFEVISPFGYPTANPPSTTTAKTADPWDTEL